MHKFLYHIILYRQKTNLSLVLLYTWPDVMKMSSFNSNKCLKDFSGKTALLSQKCALQHGAAPISVDTSSIPPSKSCRTPTWTCERWSDGRSLLWEISLWCASQAGTYSKFTSRYMMLLYMFIMLHNVKTLRTQTRTKLSTSSGSPPLSVSGAHDWNQLYNWAEKNRYVNPGPKNKSCDFQAAVFIFMSRRLILNWLN